MGSSRRVKRQHEVVHTSTLSLEGPGPGLYNDLFRAETSVVDMLPVPSRIKASEIRAKNK